MENITAKMKGLKGKVSDLEKAAAQRKAKLDENSAFLQFNWKADVVESWIGMFCVGAQCASRKKLKCTSISQCVASYFVRVSRHKPKGMSGVIPDRFW